MMKWVRKIFLDPIEFFPVFFVYSIFKLLPVQVASAVGGILAGWVGPWLPAHKIGQENIARAFPKKSSKEHKIILEKAWKNLGRVMGEFPHLRKIAKRYVTIVDHCGLTDIQNKEGPLIFFSAHLANWEIPHLVLTLRQIHISLLSRPPNNYLTRKFFEWVRYDPLVSIILKGREGSKELLRLFHTKKVLGILLDQRLSEGEKIPFFGVEAYTPVGPARLAEKFNAPMIPVQVERLEGVYFRITYHKPIKAQKDFVKTSLKINELFEKWIIEHPDQWLWFHNRWKL